MKRAAKKASFFRSRWLTVFGLLFLLAVVFGNRGFLKLVNNWIEDRSVSKEKAGLEVEKARLSERLEAMRTGDVPLERMARRDLGYIKPGETEYRFPPPKSGN